MQANVQHTKFSGSRMAGWSNLPLPIYLTGDSVPYPELSLEVRIHF